MLQAEHRQAMIRISDSFEVPPFRSGALNLRIIPETFQSVFLDRLDTLGRIVAWEEIPTSTLLAEIISAALTHFRAPPLCADLPEHDPVMLCNATNRGARYGTHGLLESRARWGNLPFASLGSLSAQALLSSQHPLGRPSWLTNIDGYYVIWIGEFLLAHVA